MINKDNGHLEILPQIKLTPNDSLDRAEGLKLGEAQELSDIRNGYKWLTLKNIEVDNEYFIITLCFLNDRLKSLNLVVSDKRFDLNGDWNSWDEPDEKRKLTEFQKWVKRQLGREGQFSWGQVNASYDQRGGSSSILVIYN